jgi:hypothetical protein
MIFFGSNLQRFPPIARRSRNYPSCATLPTRAQMITLVDALAVYLLGQAAEQMSTASTLKCDGLWRLSLGKADDSYHDISTT